MHQKRDYTFLNGEALCPVNNVMYQIIELDLQTHLNAIRESQVEVESLVDALQE